MKHAEVTADLVAAETERVVATAASFRNDAVLAPSLCEGWSRGHVLAHLARNADALARVCDVALTGAPGTMYDTPESRDADIAAGARRSADEHATDIRDSAAR
ncbi:MAG: maleylpyruvate isomerase family mycothiol-dependent enzyme, partial [Dermatophilaceae bacterium]|nr:maleylpyruvate isomerase family mycothiol-dependent enzyme [Dermatophilaceae bacterium]